MDTGLESSILTFHSLIYNPYLAKLLNQIKTVQATVCSLKPKRNNLGVMIQIMTDRQTDRFFFFRQVTKKILTNLLTPIQFPLLMPTNHVYNVWRIGEQLKRLSYVSLQTPVVMFASPTGKRFIYVFTPYCRKLPKLPSTSLRPGLYHLTGQGEGGYHNTEKKREKKYIP